MNPNAPRWSLRSWLSNTLLTGLAVLVPLGLTFYVLQAIVSAADSVLDFLLPTSWFGPHFRLPGMGLALALGVTLVAGILARNLIGRVVGQGVVSLISRVPVVAGLYKLFRQISATFLGGGGKGFKSVVLVEWPRVGTWTLAFVTGDVSMKQVGRLGLDAAQGPWLSLFIPTTPNPTSGFYFMARASETRNTKLTVEQAFKVIISGGALDPD